MSKKITTGMRIEAKRIGVKPHELGGGNIADAYYIDRAIASAVRKERERCVGIVKSVHSENMRNGRGEGAWACDDIIKEINGKS